MEVAVDEQYNPCRDGVLTPILNQGAGCFVTVVTEGVMRMSATGEWMRLYLFDMPKGSSMRTMAIAIIAPESSFDRAVAASGPSRRIGRVPGPGDSDKIDRKEG